MISAVPGEAEKHDAEQHAHDARGEHPAPALAAPLAHHEGLHDLRDAAHDAPERDDEEDRQHGDARPRERDDAREHRHGALHYREARQSAVRGNSRSVVRNLAGCTRTRRPAAAHFMKKRPARLSS